MLPVARTRAINLIADEALTANRAAAPRIELPSSIAATIRSRKSPDSGAGMTSPPTHQNRLPTISIPDSAQDKSALERTATWSADWGPPPEDPACQLPPKFRGKPCVRRWLEHRANRCG